MSPVETPHALTLAMPAFTASVTWEDVRRYLRAEGWHETRAVSSSAPDCRLWRIVGRDDIGDPHTYVGAFPGELEDERMALTISWLAILANVAPGVMLARIVGPTAPDPSTTPSARVPCLDCGRDYAETMALDLVIPRAQWLLIHPEDGGVLCACCMLRRAEKIPHAINVTGRITFGHEYAGPGPTPYDIASKVDR